MNHNWLLVPVILFLLVFLFILIRTYVVHKNIEKSKEFIRTYAVNKNIEKREKNLKEVFDNYTIGLYAPNGSLPDYILRKSSCYYLLTPKPTYTLYSEDICGHVIPPLNIWKIWFKDMMFTSPHDDMYSEMRDFCYKMDLLLDDPETPEIQRKYLNDWIESRLRKSNP